MGKLFEGKVILVTGAGSGVGQAAALTYATNGATIIVSDFEINDTISLVKYKSSGAEFIQADVSNLRDCSRLIRMIIERYGKLDIAFNSAVNSAENNVACDMSAETFNRVISTSLCGIFYCMKYEIQAMLSQGGGIIINSPNVLSCEGVDPFIGYVAAKHGIIGLTQEAAVKYANKNIRIHCFTQQIVNSPLLEMIDVKGKTASSLWHLGGQTAKAEEIAAMVIWLSSGKASVESNSCYSGEDFCLSN